uniref:Protein DETOXIFICATION n=1 Tax=Tetradesmus obliquus TaxID=3088 RepID=A0A383W375_TETOB|eukprot:jgi/Sobl393_1/12694/SZX71931.1
MLPSTGQHRPVANARLLAAQQLQPCLSIPHTPQRLRCKAVLKASHRPCSQPAAAQLPQPCLAAAAPQRPQRLQRSVAARAAAADMGGSHSIDLSSSWSMPRRLQQLLKPSKYDAELLHLAVPALAAMMLEPLMNVLSAAFMGHLGTKQLGAVSLASLATSLATYVFSFLVFLTTPRVAAAHANGDSKTVNRLAAVGLWLALGTGLLVAVSLSFSAEAIVHALNPPEPEVSAYAVQYITVRSWGILAAMLGFVASGTYRGVKDTRTPLNAAIGAALTHITLTPLFILGFDWGVAGAALAATISQWVSCVMLLSLMFKRQLLHAADLLQPPRWHEVSPYLWKGAVLALRMVVTFGMVMFASAICVRAGAASQAAFEIIRQVWIISITFFESLNVATQAMAAGFLGRHDRTSAREVLQRALHLSCFAGLILGLLLFAWRGPLVGLFTKDAAVALLGGAVMPVIALCMPIDAGASIMDGGLIAAGQTNALSVVQVAGSLVQYAVLAVLVSRGYDSVAYVWGVLKVLSLARLSGGYWLHFVSGGSAYLHRGGVSSPQQQQQQ